MAHTFVNQLKLGGYLEYKPLSFTTQKGNPFIVTLLKVERVIKEDKRFNMFFDLTAYNQEVVEKLLVLESKAFVVFNGHLGRDVYTDKNGKTQSKTKLIVTEIEYIDITGEPFKERKATAYHKDKKGELKVPQHLQDEETLDIAKMAKEIEEYKTKNVGKNLDSIELTDDDLPF